MTCDACNGSGKLIHRDKHGISMIESCDWCGGSGHAERLARALRRIADFRERKAEDDEPENAIARVALEDWDTRQEPPQ